MSKQLSVADYHRTANGANFFFGNSFEDDFRPEFRPDRPLLFLCAGVRKPSSEVTTNRSLLAQRHALLGLGEESIHRKPF